MNSVGVLCRHVRVDFHHVRHAHESRHRRNVADEIEIQILVERGVDAVRRIHKEQRVTVRRRIDHRFGAEVIPGARPVLDNELLTKPLGKPLGKDARKNVRRTAGNIADDPLDRFVRVILLRARGRNRSRQNKAARGKPFVRPKTPFVIPSSKFFANRATAASLCGKDNLQPKVREGVQKTYSTSSTCWGPPPKTRCASVASMNSSRSPSSTRTGVGCRDAGRKSFTI